MFGRVLCLCAVLFVSSPLLHANCDDVVWDQQSALSISDYASLQNQAKALVAVGASPHVLTLNVGNGSLEDAVNNVQGGCSIWRGPDGYRKADLIVFALDTQKHKSGIYFGSLFHNALDSHWHDIATTYMNPHFHDHEWEAGFAEGIRQTKARIVASRSEATGTTTINQASTDYTPLWKAFEVLGLGLLLVFGIWAIVALLRNRARRKAEHNDAYNEANAAKSAASQDLDSAKHHIREDEASGTIWTTSRKQALDQLFIDYARIPEIDDARITTNFLRIAKGQFESVSKQAKRIIHNAPEPIYDVGSVGGSVSYTPNEVRHYERAVPRYPEPSASTTVVNNNSSDGFVSGLVVGDLLSRDRDDDYDRPVRNRGGYDSDSGSGNRSYPSGGGGGSDWSSSDSGGGGGSDWSSSDSGGGGSTDF